MTNKYLQAFKKYNSKYNKADRLILTGGFQQESIEHMEILGLYKALKILKVPLEVMQNCHPIQS